MEMFMKVTIQLIGVFRTGRGKESVREYPAAATVRDVVSDLDIPLPLLGTVLIDGLHAGMDQPLGDGNTVTLLPFLEGG